MLPGRGGGQDRSVARVSGWAHKHLLDKAITQRRGGAITVLCYHHTVALLMFRAELSCRQISHEGIHIDDHSSVLHPAWSWINTRALNPNLPITMSGCMFGYDVCYYILVASASQRVEL